MSKIEAIDDKSSKLLFEIDAQTFSDAIKFVYNRNKNRINIPGFRKGKAPLQIVENYYGKDFFYNDALNHILPEEFEKALNPHDIETVGYRDLNIENISDDRTVSVSAILVLRPTAQVSEYKNLPYKPFDTNVTQEEVDKRIDAEREKNSRLINVVRPIENGDIVNINFEGFIDNVPFEGGKAENYDLTIGSHSFIDTFEDQLIGKNIGDELDVSVTFPQDYGKKELAGKPALFKVKINKISVKQLPELNDDFAQDVSEFDTLDEYKSYVMDKIREEKSHQAKHDKENQITQELIKNTTVEIPPEMINTTTHNMLRNFEHNLSAQGLNLDTYLQYMGQTRESMLKMYEPNAEQQIKIRLALESIAKTENLTATEEEVDAEINKIVEQTKLEKEKILSLLNDEEKKNIQKDIVVQKALEIVLENAKEVSENEENK